VRSDVDGKVVGREAGSWEAGRQGSWEAGRLESD